MTGTKNVLLKLNGMMLHMCSLQYRKPDVHKGQVIHCRVPKKVIVEDTPPPPLCREVHRQQQIIAHHSINVVDAVV